MSLASPFSLYKSALAHKARSKGCGSNANGEHHATITQQSRNRLRAPALHKLLKRDSAPDGFFLLPKPQHPPESIVLFPCPPYQPNAETTRRDPRITKPPRRHCTIMDVEDLAASPVLGIHALLYTSEMPEELDIAKSNA